MTADEPTARQRLVTELIARQESLAARVVAKARAEIPGYRGLDPELIQPFTERIIDHLLGAVTEQRPPTEPELRAFREFGEARARQAVSLEDVLRAWRMALRELLDEIAGLSRSLQLTDRTVLDLTNQVIDTVDQAILVFSAGHRDVELEHARHDQQTRADFVRAALAGTLGPAELGLRLQHYRLDLDTTYVPFRARPTEQAPIRELEGLLTAAARPGFTCTLDGDLAGFAEQLPDLEVAAPIGIGPAVRIDGLQSSFAQATRALNTAAAFGLSGPQDLAGLGLLPAVLADTEIGDILVHRYLEPIAGTDNPQIIIDTLRCYLDTGQRVEQTAELLYVHPNTIRYRLNRYEELTGSHLRRPGHALELWWALQRARLNPR